MRWWRYVSEGVWEDPRRTWKVALTKTLNLSVRSFLDTDLQVRAASLTYNTVLAIVPALALIFAIGRGFGFQNLLEKQLLSYFPAQSQALTAGLKFVDSYLNQASEGLFVGVGIIFLLWTLISLMGNVEDAFNRAWNVKEGRTLWRKITDYTAILLVLPILMICSGGISLMMSNVAQRLLPFDFLSPALAWVFDALSVVLVWIFYTGAYMLIPNTSVKIKNALIAGIVAGTSFVILQWAFVNGQVYVAKYNAIYGSFAFLPLLLIWLQLTWTITLAGAVVCYSLQNIYNLSYINHTENISTAYREKITLAVMTVVVNRFGREAKAPTLHEIVKHYDLPANLVADILLTLEKCGLVNRVALSEDRDADPGYAPAIAIGHITVERVLSTVSHYGDSDFIPGFKERFEPGISIIDDITDAAGQAPAASTLLTDIVINQPHKKSHS